MKTANFKLLFLVLVILFQGWSVHAQQKGWPRGGTSDNDKVEASPLLVNLDSDNRMEIIVPSFDDKLYIYKHDGTAFNANWPKVLGFSDGTIASVAVGNVDGGSDLEIVVLGDDINHLNATVKVYKPATGNLLTSKNLNTIASGKATPCLIDCYRYSGATRHSELEILVRDGNGKVHILKWNSGTQQLDTVSTFETCTEDSQRDRYGSQPITPSVSAEYLGNDETFIVVPSTNNKVYCRKVKSDATNNWNLLSNFTIESGGPDTTRFLSSAVLADVDDDESSEIIVGTTSCEVYVWDNTGTLCSGWPQNTSQPVISSPAVADLDDDDDLEIMVGCDDGLVYIWNEDGTSLSGWPKGTLGDIFGSPVAAEVDGNVGLDVVAASFDGYMYAWTSSGNSLSGWPKNLNTPVFASPAVCDIHDGGRMAIVTAGYDGQIFVFDVSPKSLDVDAGWQQFRGGIERQGHN